MKSTDGYKGGVWSLDCYDNADPKGTQYGFRPTRPIFYAGVRTFQKTSVVGMSAREWVPKTYGPVLGGVFIPPEPNSDRKTTEWSWAYAAQVDSNPADVAVGTTSAPGAGELKARVVYQGDKSGWKQSDATTDKLSQVTVFAPFGQKFPKGTPGTIVRASDLTSQNRIFVPAGGTTIAIHYGTKPNGKLGSRVFDTTVKGELDLGAWAREQSGRRVYIYPTATGAGGFTFTRPLDPGENPAEVAPGGLAWQLGPDVDGQGGHGVCADLPSASGQPVDPSTQSDPGTKEKPPALPPGSVSSLKQGPNAAKANSKGAPGQIRITFFGGFGTSTYLIPWDGSQETLNWVRNNAELAGYTLGGRLVSADPVPGSGSSSSTSTQSKPGGTPGTTGGTVTPQVLAASTWRAFGTDDCGGDGDIHEISRNSRGEPVNTKHEYELQIVRGPTGDAAKKYDPTIWQKVGPDGPFWHECYRRTDPKDFHDWLTGKLPGLRKIQVASHISTPSGPYDGPTPGGAAYPSFSQAIGVTEIIGRFTASSPAVDGRYLGALNEDQIREFNRGPVAIRLVPFVDQTRDTLIGDSFFNTGHAKRGGFVVAAGNYDPNILLRGGTAPTDAEVAFTFGTKAYLAFGDVLKNGNPKSGVQIYLSAAGTLSVDTFDSLGAITSTGTLWPSGGSTNYWQDTGTYIELNTSYTTRCVKIQSACITSSSQTNSESFGEGASTSSTGSTSVGRSAQTGTDGVAVGYQASATGTNATGVGRFCSASATYATALGRSSTASNTGAMALGGSTTCGGFESLVIGYLASITSAQNAVAVGARAGAGTSSVAIGWTAIAAEGVGKINNVAIGESAHAYTAQGVCIGQSSSCADESVVVGYLAGDATHTNNVAIGSRSSSYTSATAVGYNSFAFTNNVALGRDSSAFGTNELSGGSDGYPLSSVTFGSGSSGTILRAYTFKNTPAAGVDVVGPAIYVETGLGTGAAASGRFAVKIGQPLASGSTVQTSSEVLGVSASGVTVTGKLTVTGVIDPTMLLLSGSDKRLGCTDAGTLYLAPFANQVGAVEVRQADNTTSVLSIDTLNKRVGIGTRAPLYALDVVGDVNVSGTVRFNGLARQPFASVAPGSGVASLGFQCPALDPTAVVWVAVTLDDGRTGVMPVWV